MTESILTAEKVETITKDCLFHDGEDTSKAIKVLGLVNNFGFHPERLKGHKEEIKTLLMELPETFHQSGGGGWSFLNACNDKNNRQWGEHINMEMLFVLGIGVGLAKWQMPRDMWSVLPGGMPYVVVLDKAE